VHNLLAYKQHPELIGNKVKEHGVPEPAFLKFNDIRKGDQIVYYATRDMVIVGIFEVNSDKKHLQGDPLWNEMVVFSIEHIELPTAGYYLDLKKLLSDPSVKLDAFPQKERWGSYIQGRACILLTERDFRTIKKAISNEEYLKNIQSID
jgi:hypothetical protein